MEKILLNFETYLKDKGKSRITIENCLPHIRAFLRSKKVIDLSTVSSQMIMDYFAELKPKCSQAKFNQAIWSLKTFSLWANVTGVELPKQKRHVKKIRQPITEEELENVIEPRLGNIFPGYSLHIKSILYFLFYTGLDKSRLAYIKRSDFCLHGREVILNIPKMRILRRIPLSECLVRILEMYFMTEGEEKNALNTNIGKINRIFKKLQKEKVLGERRAITPEVFKNSFACNCVEKGISLWTLQELMKHKDVKTTVGYLKVMSNEAKKDYLKKVNA